MASIGVGSTQPSTTPVTQSFTFDIYDNNDQSTTTVSLPWVPRINEGWQKTATSDQRTVYTVIWVGGGANAKIIVG